jgi:hypothetical protein
MRKLIVFILIIASIQSFGVDPLRHINWTGISLKLSELISNNDTLKNLLYLKDTATISIDTTQVRNLLEFVGHHGGGGGVEHDPIFAADSANLVHFAELPVETDPKYAIDSSYIKTGVRSWNSSVLKNVVAKDTTNWGRAESDPKYCASDSALLKSTRRAYLIDSSKLLHWSDTISTTKAIGTKFNISSKVDKITGKGLSTNDFTTAIRDTVIININFLDLGVFTYNVPLNMTLTHQTSEGTAATLSPTLNNSMNQFTKLTVTPNAVGLVILSGHKN